MLAGLNDKAVYSKTRPKDVTKVMPKGFSQDQGASFAL